MNRSYSINCRVHYSDYRKHCSYRKIAKRINTVKHINGGVLQGVGKGVHVHIWFELHVRAPCACDIICRTTRHVGVAREQVHNDLGGSLGSLGGALVIP